MDERQEVLMIKSTTMKEKNYSVLAQELREYLGEMNEGIAVEVTSDEGGIEVMPASKLKYAAFHYTEEIVDFCRFKKLSNYISFDAVEDCIKCRIF